jgi:hypothetical protein
MLLVAQTLHTAYARSRVAVGRRNVQMALAAVVALRAALTLSPHNAELRLEVFRRHFLHFFSCLHAPLRP